MGGYTGHAGPEFCSYSLPKILFAIITYTVTSLIVPFAIRKSAGL